MLLGTIVVLVLFFVFFMPVIIEIRFLKNKTNDEIILNFKTFYGLIKYKLEVPMIDLVMKKNGKVSLDVNTEIEQGQKEELVKEKDQLLDLKELQKIQDKIDFYYNSYYTVLVFIRNKIFISKLSWATELGTGDAAVTGMLTGILWGIKGNLISIIERHVHCKKSTLDIIPHFNKQILETKLHCIIQLKIGYIIIASIKFCYTFFLRGGEKNGKSSHRSTDENNNGKSQRHD